MSDPSDTVLEVERVREVVAVFRSRDALYAAIDDLLLAGFRENLPSKAIFWSREDSTREIARSSKVTRNGRIDRFGTGPI